MWKCEPSKIGRMLDIIGNSFAQSDEAFEAVAALQPAMEEKIVEINGLLEQLLAGTPANSIDNLRALTNSLASNDDTSIEEQLTQQYEIDFIKGRFLVRSDTITSLVPIRKLYMLIGYERCVSLLRGKQSGEPTLVVTHFLQETSEPATPCDSESITMREVLLGIDQEITALAEGVGKEISELNLYVFWHYEIGKSYITKRRLETWNLDETMISNALNNLSTGNLQITVIDLPTRLSEVLEVLSEEDTIDVLDREEIKDLILDADIDDKRSYMQKKANKFKAGRKKNGFKVFEIPTVLISSIIDVNTSTDVNSTFSDMERDASSNKSPGGVSTFETIFEGMINNSVGSLDVSKTLMKTLINITLTGQGLLITIGTNGFLGSLLACYLSGKISLDVAAPLRKLLAALEGFVEMVQAFLSGLYGFLSIFDGSLCLSLSSLMGLLGVNPSTSSIIQCESNIGMDIDMPKFIKDAIGKVLGTLEMVSSLIADAMIFISALVGLFNMLSLQIDVVVPKTMQCSDMELTNFLTDVAGAVGEYI